MCRTKSGTFSKFFSWDGCLVHFPVESIPAVVAEETSELVVELSRGKSFPVLQVIR